MLRLTVLLVALYVGYTSADKTVVHLVPEKIVEVLPKIMECISESGVDPEVLDNLRKGTLAEFKDDPSVAKFLFCSFKKSDIIKEDGRIDADNFLNFYPGSADKAAIQKAIQECDKPGKDPVDTTFQFMKCYHKNSPVKVMF